MAPGPASSAAAAAAPPRPRPAASPRAPLRRRRCSLLAASAGPAAAAAAAAASPAGLPPAAAANRTAPSAPAQSGAAQSGAAQSAEARLKQLAELQEASRAAVTERRRGGGGRGAPPGTVDARVYEQLVGVYNRMAEGVKAHEAHVQALNAEIARCNDDLMAAHELLKQISREFGSTRRMAQSAAAAVSFGVDREEALGRVDKLTQRLAAMEESVDRQRAEFGAKVVRRVPLEWVGCASEVVLMGEWDGWTRGQELSAEDVTSDAVFSRFEGAVLLRPGRYRVKLLVDGGWRLAADWPTEMDDAGNEVNVLTVE